MKILVTVAFVLFVLVAPSCKTPSILGSGAACGPCGCFPVDCGNGKCCDQDEMCDEAGLCEWVGPPMPGPNGEFDYGGARPDAGAKKTHPDHPQTAFTH